MRLGCALFLGALLAACDGSITDIDVVSPELQDLTLEMRGEQEDGGLSILGIVADPAFQPRTHTRLRVSLRTDGSGDEEPVLLWPDVRHRAVSSRALS